ncbi:MAG: DUF559 domain-containing protein [Acidimicrobiia bacterium]
MLFQAGEVLRRKELVARGMSRRELERAIRAGSVRRFAHGLYEVLDPCRAEVAPDPAAVWWRAARRDLALGGVDAVLARASACTAFDLDGFRPGLLPIELNGPRRTGGSIRAAVRRVAPLEPPLVIDGLPVTTIGQTLVELGSTLTADPLPVIDRVELALECALHRRLITLIGLEDVLGGAAGRRRVPVLRAVLARRPHGAPPTESWLETRMVQLLRDGGLPDPQRQVELRDSDGFIGRVDLLLDALVVELHGAQHNDGAALDADRLRRARLEAAGYRVLEFGYRSVVQQPVHVVSLVRATLDRLR